MGRKEETVYGTNPSSSHSVANSADSESVDYIGVPHYHEKHYGNPQGISWVICSFLIVGELAGGGLVALPNSMVDAGLTAGIILTVVSALASIYTGIQLGENWLMMQDRWPEYRQFCRKPYPEMGYRAIGEAGRICVSVLVAVQQFGMAVVFLLLSSRNISSLIYAFFDINANFCIIIVIVAVALLPFLMLGSPKDFWQAAVIAALSTTTAVVLIFIATSLDAPTCKPEAYYGSIQMRKFFLAYGTITFAYGGHSCFPTFQHDMKKPYEFKKSVVLGYILVILLYLPVAIFGYIVYGDSVGTSIIESLQTQWAQQAANILITIHVTFTQIIIISPLTLELEEQCHIPNRFSMSRFILRSVLLLSIVFVALSVPKFGVILDLIGGTTATLTSMILPGVFYMFIRAAREKSGKKVSTSKVREDSRDAEMASITDVFRYIPKWVLAINLAVIAFGLVGGIASTVSAVNELIVTSFDVPCYIQVFSGFSPNEGGKVNCCGEYKNITTGDQGYNDFCVIPNATDIL